MTAFVDTCEPRRLMAAISTAVMDGAGNLTITGTAGNDRIRIVNYNGRAGDTVPAASPTRIAVIDGDRLIGTFHTKPMKGVFVDLGNGNDSFTVQQWTADANHRLTFNNLIVYGGQGDDAITIDVPGYTGIHGGVGRDTVLGCDGTDVIWGGDGDDVIDGRGGADFAHGEGGNDTFLGGSRADGTDRYDGGLGVNTIDYSQRAQGVAVITAARKPNGPLLLDGRTGRRDPGKAYAMPEIASLYGTGGLENDSLINFDDVYGSQGDDVIVGNAADNMLHGNAGDDWIVGGLGNDAIYGDAGNDRLFSADSRDGMPIISPTSGFDTVDGGGGGDLLRTDGHDTLLKADQDDRLPFLSA